ncbi:MAG: DUF1273 family protein [Clostridia bacterium]|nr:DUF1273 family protein [Clostridia bacterium]
MSTLREKTCCFTGHRTIAPARLEPLLENLNMEILWLISHGITNFWAGGALGFDTLAALSVLRFRADGSPIRLHMALPCWEQTRYWKSRDIEVYNDILMRADSIKYISDHFYGGVMHQRNRFMVDQSSYCVCFYDHEQAKATKSGGSGTLYTVNYARKHGLTLINLCDEPPDDGQLEFDFTV